jgi:hypothetical protein
LTTKNSDKFFSYRDDDDDDEEESGDKRLTAWQSDTTTKASPQPSGIGGGQDQISS